MRVSARIAAGMLLAMLALPGPAYAQIEPGVPRPTNIPQAEIEKAPMPKRLPAQPRFCNYNPKPPCLLASDWGTTDVDDNFYRIRATPQPYDQAYVDGYFRPRRGNDAPKRPHPIITGYYLRTHRFDLALPDINHYIKTNDYPAHWLAIRSEIFELVGRRDLAIRDLDAALAIYLQQEAAILGAARGKDTLGYLLVRRANFHIDDGQLTEAKALLAKVQVDHANMKKRLAITVQRSLKATAGWDSALAARVDADLSGPPPACGSEPETFAMADAANYRLRDLVGQRAKQALRCGQPQRAVALLEPFVFAVLKLPPEEVDDYFARELNGEAINWPLLREAYAKAGQTARGIALMKPVWDRATRGTTTGWWLAEAFPGDLIAQLHEDAGNYSAAIDIYSDIFFNSKQGWLERPEYAQRAAALVTKASQQGIPLSGRRVGFARDYATGEWQRRQAESDRFYAEMKQREREKENARIMAENQAISNRREALAAATMARTGPYADINFIIAECMSAGDSELLANRPEGIFGNQAVARDKNRNVCTSARQRGRDLARQSGNRDIQDHYDSIKFPWE